jgi:hypothetical protein
MPIIEAPRALREYGLATTYQRLWRAVVAGEVPAERVGKKWHVRTADLPIIAQILKK